MTVSVPSTKPRRVPVTCTTSTTVTRSGTTQISRIALSTSSVEGLAAVVVVDMADETTSCGGRQFVSLRTTGSMVEMYDGA